MTAQLSFFDAPGHEEGNARTIAATSSFDLAQFVECFGALAEAEGGIKRLRGLVLDLAVRGALTGTARHIRVVEGRPFAIPESWRWSKGRDVFVFVTSGSRGWAQFYAAEGPIFLRIGNLDYDSIDLDLREIQRVCPPPNAEGVRTRVQAGDVLISITGDTGMVGLVPDGLGDAYINQHIALARPSLEHFPAYLARALTAPSLLTLVQSAQRGIKNSLGLEDIREMPIPLPPLAEQKRIVAKVDELMRMLDDLEAKQTKKRELQGRLRTAALNALTSAEGPEEFGAAWKRVAGSWEVLFERAESVRELRRAALDIAITGRLTSPTAPRFRAQERIVAVPTSWRWLKGREVFSYVTSGSRGWAQHYSDEGALFLRIGNLDYESIALDLRNVQRVTPPENAEGTRTRVQPGDVLVSITGDTGMVGLVPHGIGEAYINQHIALARPGPMVVPEFIARALTAPTILGRVQEAQRGIKNSLGLDDIRHLLLPVPPLEEQQRIVTRVADLMKLCDDLEAKLKAKEQMAAKLVEAVAKDLVA